MPTTATAMKKGEGGTDSPMKVVGRKYASVSELVRDTSDAGFADEFDKYQADRGLVNCLTIIRCANGVSQVELAKRMDCAQSKISKMETSADADLSFGDVVSFALALQQSIRISFSPSRKNGSDHIRFHVECIKHALDGLVRINGDDKDTCDDVEAFAIQTVQNMVTAIESALDKLPHRMQQPSSPVSVEAEGERGQRLRLDLPRSLRRRTKKSLPA
jgi:hypothetical protein